MRCLCDRIARLVTGYSIIMRPVFTRNLGAVATWHQCARMHTCTQSRTRCPINSLAWCLYQVTNITLKMFAVSNDAMSKNLKRLVNRPNVFFFNCVMFFVSRTMHLHCNLPACLTCEVVPMIATSMWSCIATYRRA